MLRLEKRFTLIGPISK